MSERTSFYSPSTFTLDGIDLDGFTRELDALKAETYASISSEDLVHLRRIELRGRLATFLGLATAWIAPNPVSAVLLHLGMFTRWLIAHHVLHKGYERVPGIPARFTSKCFAQGWRRFIDWFDWFEPAAWSYEHNQLHHYHTGEADDPDLLEQHLRFLRKLRAPNWVKVSFIMLASLTWKFTYYAPNTSSVLHPDTQKRVRSRNIVWLTIKNVLQLSRRDVRALWLGSYIPYVTFHFGVVPLVFLPLGKTAVLYVLLNKIFAEALTNMHTFLIIGPNHTADDLHRYGFHFDSKREFYVVQVLASANYRTGTGFVDFMSLWLNYQIEHHLFPDLPMLKYRAVQPKVKLLCERYGIPYRQEPITMRLKRMFDVCTGRRNMRALEAFPRSVPEEPGASEAVSAALERYHWSPASLEGRSSPHEV